MKYIVRKYYSGYCTYEVNADSENNAYELANKIPVNYDQFLETLEDWEDCNEVELIING